MKQYHFVHDFPIFKHMGPKVKRKAVSRNWHNQNPNPALDTKVGIQLNIISSYKKVCLAGMKNLNYNFVS